MNLREFLGDGVGCFVFVLIENWHEMYGGLLKVYINNRRNRKSVT